MIFWKLLLFVQKLSVMSVSIEWPSLPSWIPCKSNSSFCSSFWSVLVWATHKAFGAIWVNSRKLAIFRRGVWSQHQYSRRLHYNKNTALHVSWKSRSGYQKSSRTRYRLGILPHQRRFWTKLVWAFRRRHGSSSNKLFLSKMSPTMKGNGSQKSTRTSVSSLRDRMDSLTIPRWYVDRFLLREVPHTNPHGF